LIYVTASNNKEHISYSEVKEWHDCPFRHKLKYIDGIELFKSIPAIDFGTAVHSMCEHFLKTKEMDFEKYENKINELWEKYKDNPLYSESEKQKCNEHAKLIMNEIPNFMQENFGEWEFIACEEMLMEQIQENSDTKFKGFIDGVIKGKKLVRTKIKEYYWIIDWKTTSWGWAMSKKNDLMVKSQIVLYKSFWSTKNNIDIKDVKCGFVLLKKDAKDGNRCELVEISAGEETIKKSLNILNSCINGIKSGIVMKKTYNCKYCAYDKTEYCVK
jgi:hypothetical protein